MLGRPDRTVVVVESAGAAATRPPRRGAPRPASTPVRLDPFGVLGGPADQFNPLDLLRHPHEAPAADALHLAELLLPEEPMIIDPFWRVNAVSLVYGLLGCLPATPERQYCLPEVQALLSDGKALAAFGKALDAAGDRLPADCLQMLVNHFGKGDGERTSIDAIAYEALAHARGAACRGAFRNTTFDLQEVAAGKPTTIYIELPILRLEPHGLLARLWLGSLLTWFRRSSPPGRFRPLVIVDSPFSGLLFPPLHAARAAGLADVWTFWESLDQLRSGQPSEWSAFLANAGTVEALGPQSPVVAGELASVFGQSRKVLQSLVPGQRMALNG